jgi:hypothetical protein
LAGLVLEADPDGSKSSFEEGLADRKVSVYPNPDHTANFGVYSAHPQEVVEARAHVEKIARSLKTSDESRTLDQLRVDVALDLFRGRCACEDPRYRVGDNGGASITVPAATLAELSDEPGEFGVMGRCLLRSPVKR